MKNVKCKIAFAAFLFFSQNMEASKPVFQKSQAKIYCSDCPIFKRNCTGEKEYKNGDFYSGQFRFGKPHGKGTYTWTNGEVYKGDFDLGVEHGYGKKIYSDGSIYEGDWWDGWRHGKGAYSFVCGDEFYGDFVDDQISGEGTILFSTGESYSGFWKDNLADGYGIFSRSDGSHFEGNSQRGQKDGEGMMVWESGDTLWGNWSLGKLEDDATFKFRNGATLKTFWENGFSDEMVVYTTDEGIEFSGNQNQIAELIIKQNFHLIESVESNLQLAWYGIAMEYKSVHNYKLAFSFLSRAKAMELDQPNSEILDMVNLEFAKIKTEQNQSGVASSLKK